MQIYGEKLKDWMNDYVEKDKFNGCSLSMADSNGNTVLDIASGFNDKERTKEFNSRTIVRIFSMTKAVVSACLLQLLHERNIRLDETLNHYFDNYSDCFALVENAKNVTEIEKTNTLFGSKDDSHLFPIGRHKRRSSIYIPSTRIEHPEKPLEIKKTKENNEVKIET